MTKQNKLIIGIISLALMLSVGYALFSKVINVGGTANATGEFSIIFNSVGVINEVGSKNASATITQNKKELTVNVPELSYPGAYVEIPVVIKNSGSINARIKGIVTTGMSNDDINVTYSEIKQYQKLSPNEEKMMKIKITWESSSISNSSTISFKIGIDYEQDTSNNPEILTPGGEIPKEVFVWETDTKVSGLTDEGIEYVKANDGWLIIPYGVEEIGFMSYPDIITAINISNSVKVIDDDAFIGLKIDSVYIPNSVEIIGNHAFTASSISNVIFENGVKTIGDGAFSYCENLRSISIPDSVETIGMEAFMNSSVTELYLGNGVKTIGDSAFIGLPLSGNLVIPNSVTSIGFGAFELTKISSLTLSNNLISIGELAFADCENLSGNIFIPNDKVLIGNSAFKLSDPSQNKVKKISISKNASYVNDGTENDSFYGRPTLTFIN